MTKKNKNVITRMVSGFLTLLLTLSLCPEVFAVEGSVSIGTADELSAFAVRCSSDEYSRGLKVVLTADIDITGMDISIPIFLGTFDGQGYRITGLHLDQSASDYGLFGKIESGAVVKNLSVEGEVAPSGTQSNVGGMIGENYGTIENCIFFGIVIGGNSTGGIAGYNGSGGTITNCNAFGAVRGTKYTGGIVGQNAGTLLRCTNAASVNTTVHEEGSSYPENLENTLYSILKKEDVTESTIITDTGGIAGYSTGAIQSCTNTGAIGYPHVGYNAGGIAGRQNGYLANCVNRGTVQGRKDVGGIVGQMAPDVTLRFSSNGLDELQSELNTLQNLINRTLDDAQSASDTVSGRVSRISGYADNARDSANSLSGQFGDFADDNISTANDVLLLVERYIDKAIPILDDLSESSDAMTDTIAQLQKLSKLLDDNMEYNDQVLLQLQGFTAEMEAACEALVEAMDTVDRTIALIEGGLNPPDTQHLREDTVLLTTALAALNEAINTAFEEYINNGSVSAETQERLKVNLRTALDCYSVLINDLNNMFESTDFTVLRQQKEETLRQIANYLQNAMSLFSTAVSCFDKAMGELRGALGTLRTLNVRLEDVFAQLDSVMESAQQASADLTRALYRGSEWAGELMEEDPGTFSLLGTQFTESSDSLNASLSGISNELSALNREMTSSNTLILSDIRAVNDQFMKVMNLFFNILNNTKNENYSDVFEDISEESLKSAARGKVLECTNYGDVTADRNAGGIAGAMAIEYDQDPEDDLLSSENRSAHFTYQTKAILLDCSNYGKIEAKKSCAGGVTGRMDLGTVSGCGGWGDVSSKSGDYVGGVAGLSLSSIRESYAKCTLSGGKYVGGITGSGVQVSDSLSMVEIADCIQFGGAVAGEMTGEYRGNRFVSEVLAGVDRVSLSGKAEEVSYDALRGLENIPENFLHLTLTFVADGKTLKQLTFDYGDSFELDIYPDAPVKEDEYVRWDKAELKELHFDTVVTAIYEPYVTTLASNAVRDGRAALLAEGRFRAGDSLYAEMETNLTSFPGKVAELWTLQFPDDGQEIHTVRWLIPSDGSGTYTIYADNGNGMELMKYRVIGDYLCFEMSGNGQITVVAASQGGWWIWVLAVAGGTIIIGGFLLLYRKFGNPKNNMKNRGSQ